MNREQVRRRIFHLLAKILEYPQADLAEAVYECEALLSLENSAAVTCLREFRDFIAETSLGRLQEIYTVTFDLDATCHPYVGYHLFGESYKRSAFMLGLKERYAGYGLDTGSELPDHLAMLLRYLALCDDAGQAGEMIHEALLPALERMIKPELEEEQETLAAGPHRQRIYQAALAALRLLLQQLQTNDPGRTTKEDLLVAGQSSLVG
ncbi:MAG: nitrate reductase molybdenum cofactor assembly chaperone [Chloroflexi bacterium]|nr:nitrate reductase molybdenum cofactor assembly chaperone [Chloroflexota bacterium]